MPHYELEYPKEPFNTVKRYNSRASYALETIHAIINTCPLLHVSFNAPGSPFPVTLPMIGHMGSFERPSADLGDVLELYLHGYVSSRLMRLGRENNNNDNNDTSEPAAEDANNDTNEKDKGLPVTIAASHLDGLVLALTPNSHSYNYRSAVLFGHAQLVSDDAEKLYALRLLTNGVVPGRWAATRVPPNAAEMSSTSVLRVRVASGSAKVRAGMPHDDRADIADEGLLDRVWTGVVPVAQVLGAPVPGPYNRLKELPEYLAEHVTAWNADVKSASEEAAREKEVPGKGKE